jgi:hypothetical protein
VLGVFATTPGVGRADVWVFDANALGDSLGGTPLAIATLFTDTPRALAVTPDGSRVYAAGFHTGDQTASVTEQVIPDGFGSDGVVGPATKLEGKPAPQVGEIATAMATARGTATSATPHRSRRPQQHAVMCQTGPKRREHCEAGWTSPTA